MNKNNSTKSRFNLPEAPLRTFWWFTFGASALGIISFFLVNKFLLGDISQSADTIAAISGFAISVSGSVVAILIATQALRQQDEISKVERTALAAEEAARKVENKLQELDRQRE